jgi:prepilin-type N-terminal cleavage/methylation domain-containing protein
MPIRKVKHQLLLSEQGFSLLELLVVISLLAILATASMTLMIDTSGIERQDFTEKKWDAIHKAIVGDNSQTLNGTPLLRGYAADMGRLPNNIKELMSQGVSQPDWASVDINPSGTAYVNGLSGQLFSGWRGPYLYTAGSSEYTDGWRKNGNATDFDVNFGWDVSFTSVSSTNVAMQVISLGDDALIGGVEYGEDFPDTGEMAVNQNDWLVSISGVEFDVNFNAASGVQPSSDLELIIYYVKDNNIDFDSETFGYSGTTGASVSGTYSQSVFITTGEKAPMGRFAAAIVCSTGEVYDGNCADTTFGPKKAYYFTLLPSTRHVTIPWNTP